jgi:hypothetical protein
MAPKKGLQVETSVKKTGDFVTAGQTPESMDLQDYLIFKIKP